MTKGYGIIIGSQLAAAMHTFQPMIVFFKSKMKDSSTTFGPKAKACPADLISDLGVAFLEHKRRVHSVLTSQRSLV